MNCTDPKRLFQNVIQKPTDFIHTVWIKTFGIEKLKFTKSDDSFDSLWHPMDFVHDPIDFGSSKPISTLCYELIIPKSLQALGIQAVRIETEHYSGNYLIPFEGLVKVSPPGYFYQNSDIEATYVNSFGKLDIHLEHQVDIFLKVGDETCDPDPLYNRDECVLKQLLSVTIKIQITVFLKSQFSQNSHF